MLIGVIPSQGAQQFSNTEANRAANTHTRARAEENYVLLVATLAAKDAPDCPPAKASRTTNPG